MPHEPIPVFRRERTVREDDTDALGHVNNLVWVQWVVELAEAHAAAVGFDFETTVATGGIWVVHRQEIDYQRGAVPGEQIREATWVSEMRGARSLRHSRLTGGDGVVRLSATTAWAWVDARSLRVRRMPSEVKDRFVLVPPEGPDAP